ncbi:piggyBac transposable element-derived protein 3-like [Nilaparvata lugens]|uniref:piggyBac transposable element-derived protein 3-like n=1 Tax=Nilaparvata lugens TaxID=108931 RepID=UPI00193EBFB9|nr:piggyBac transposable element-derived protein 3-like [Nilaparvata lugens]
MDIRFEGVTLREALEILEGDDIDGDPSQVFIEPPDANIQSDADSGEEDGGGYVNNLSGKQLLSNAEIVFNSQPDKSTQEIPPIPSTSTGKSKEKRKSDNTRQGTNKKRKTQSRPNKKSRIEPVSMWEEKDEMTFNGIFPNPDYTDLRDKNCMHFFEKFIDDEIIDLLVLESNKYALHCNRADPRISREEMRVFLGILLLSSYVRVSDKRMYWEDQSDTHNIIVANSMRRNRFLEISRNLHCADNTNYDRNDKMFKLRPLIEKLRIRFKEAFRPEPTLSYDEAMIEYFGPHPCKQFIRGKPIRFGYKVWCLNTPSGYLVDFEIYQGKSPNGNEEYMAKFGKCASPLVSMLDELPDEKRNLPYKIYFDNLFTGIPLLVHLQSCGYGATGTMRENRIPKDCPLEAKALLVKEKRGTYKFVKDTNLNILVCKWVDNSVVTVSSTCHGITPLDKIQRYCTQEKKRIPVNRPCLIKEYNENMGGADRMDQNVSHCRINVRGKKWYWSILTWLIDVATHNAWLLMKKSVAQDLTQIEFRRTLVQVYLGRYGIPSQQGRAITSGPRAELELRYDETRHYVANVKNGLRRRCGLEECKSVPRTECIKCDVGLCIGCFVKYHTKQ